MAAFQPSLGGNFSALNISAPTVVQVGKGVLTTFVVTTAGSSNGAIYDAATTGGNTAANLIAPIINALGDCHLDWPCFNGILIVPGTGQVVSVAYS